MSVTANPVVVWFLRQTRLIQYFILALFFHLLILSILGTVKVATYIPRYSASFEVPSVARPNGSKSAPALVTTSFHYQVPLLQGLGGASSGQTAVRVPKFKTPLVASLPRGMAASSYASPGGAQSSPTGASSRATIPSGIVAAPSLASRYSFEPPQSTGQGSSNIRHFENGVPTAVGSFLANRPFMARKAALQQFATGDPRLETAVLNGLRYCQRTQEADGSWTDGGNAMITTALVTLAFLGHGETPESPEFGPTVDRALRYLVQQTGADGANISRFGSSVLALTTLAFAEGYAMTREPKLLPPLEKGIQDVASLLENKVAPSTKTIVSSRSANPFGSDFYAIPWMLMALNVARDTGLPIPGNAIPKTEEYLIAHFRDSQTDNQVSVSGFAQHPKANPTALATACGVVGLQFLGKPRDSRVNDSLELIMREAKIDWNQPAPSDYPLYTWHCVSQGVFHAQDFRRDNWQSWIRLSVNSLALAQKPDGSWGFPQNAIVEAQMAGRETFQESSRYATALCVLILETSYRYLLVHQHVFPALNQ